MKTPPMRSLSPTLLLVALSLPCTALLAQAPAAQAPAAQSPYESAPQPQTASSIMNPALSTLQQALDGIRLDRWKTSGTLRDEADSNITSIRRDLEATLPPLLSTADAAPNSVAQVLPVFRNIEALYDVLLRIAAVSRLAAPPQQTAALDQAISTLESSRRTLGDQLQSSALGQDRKVHDLQASLRAVPPPAPAPAPCPPPPAPVKKRKPRPKPAAAPATPQTTTPPSN